MTAEPRLPKLLTPLTIGAALVVTVFIELFGSRLEAAAEKDHDTDEN